MSQHSSRLFFDDVELIVTHQGNSVSLHCDEAHGAITTLVNLMGGATGHSTVSSVSEAELVYNQLTSGKGFLSEGFTVRRLTEAETLNNQACYSYKAWWESINGPLGSRRIWKIKNQWDDYSNFLVEETFLRIVNFAYTCYLRNTVPD